MTFDAEQVILWQQALNELSQNQFFEAHETLEVLWMQLQSPTKQAVQGLIQWAVAGVHLQNQNEKGAKGLFQRAIRNLQCAELPGLDSQNLCQQAQNYLNWLQLPVASRGSIPALLLASALKNQ